MIKTVITNYLDFCFWLEKNKRPVMGFDTETTSLNYLKLECIGFSMATDDAACYVTLDNPSNAIDYFMQLNGITLVMHNAVFDLKVLHKHGYEPEKIFCTLTGAKLVNENLQEYGLKALASLWLCVPSTIVHTYEEVCANIHSEEFYEYAMNDAIWAYQLYKYEVKIMQKEDTLYLATEIEMPFQFVLRDLEINGVLVDIVKLEKFKHECSTILITVESDMLLLFNKKHSIQGELWSERPTYISPINFGSSQQLITCCTSLGFEVDEKTKKGNPSVGKTYLQRMKGKHKFFDLLWRYRKLQKLSNSFLEPLVCLIDSDGRVRPSYNMVTTGRLSCSNPALQQLPNPKKEKLEFNHREIFIPAEGNVFVKADYSGQELRNLAEVSGDVNMRTAFNSGYDLHIFTANRIFNLGLADAQFVDGTPEHKEASKKHKEKRHQAKNGVNFPTVYGAFAQRIAGDNGVSIIEAQSWLDEFDKLYPGVKKWKQEVKAFLKKNLYISTLMGRRRRFPDYRYVKRWDKAKMERQATNFPIQGLSADQMKVAAVKIRQFQEDFRARLVLSVHDELVWELPSEYAKSFSCKVKETMENCVSMNVPVLVEVKTVNNYGE